LAYVANRRKEKKVKSINKLQANPKKGYNYMKIKYLTFLAFALVAGSTTPAIAAVVVVNNSFEANTGLNPQTNYDAANLPGGVPGWTFTLGTGSYGGIDTSYGNPGNTGGLQAWSPFPDGTQAAWIYGRSASFSQSVSGFEALSTTVSFYASSRPGHLSIFGVTLDGTALKFSLLDTITPDSNGWTLYTSDAFIATPGINTLAFTSTSGGGSDGASFIDVVNITQIPEPAIMSLLGLSGLMLVLRKRKSSKV
jgi:hypothetical protein